MFTLPAKATIRADIGLLLTFIIGLSGDCGIRPLTPAHADQVANVLTIIVYAAFTIAPIAIQAWREVQHAAIATPAYAPAFVPPGDHVPNAEPVA